jgi:putative glutamine amidotransferase
MSYLRTLDAAGAMPVVLPPVGDADEYLDRLDGICLSGGPDLDPDAYGASERHAELGPTEPSLDAFELALLTGALERGMPILAICRGAQVINVARGGTLYQHIPETPGALVEHRQKELGHMPTHHVTVAPGTLLHETLGTDTLDVNSFHHQSVETLGANLRESARAEDGIIEGIEAIDRDYLVGVQWHAESLTDATAHESLFRGLVEAAKRYREGSDTRRMRAV